MRNGWLTCKTEVNNHYGTARLTLYIISYKSKLHIYLVLIYLLAIVRVRGQVLGNPYQMVWSPFGDEELAEDAVVEAYRHFDRERIRQLGA